MYLGKIGFNRAYLVCFQGRVVVLRTKVDRIRAKMFVFE